MTEHNLPTRSEAAWFQLRAACFRLKRAVTDRRGGGAPHLQRASIRVDAGCVAESRTVLFNSTSPAEFALQAGKVQNLRIAARELNGTVIPSGAVLSFWKNLGRASRGRGFVAGRELREGCVIPNTGGGLCQLSNALYEVALRSDCEIVERHAHTHLVPGSTTQPGRDATIFWNYVDFQFRPPFDCQLQVALSRGELLVALFDLSGGVRPAVPPTFTPPSCETRTEVIETCETCGVTKCFRNPAATSLPRNGITAWLLDRCEPEFQKWIAENQTTRDAILVPLKSRQLANYGWDTQGFAQVRDAPMATLRRSMGSRRVATQGAARQRALLKFDYALASAFGREIPHVADHLVISQNLLPYVWRHGDLGGRTFDVLMTRLPMADLERTLDQAATVYPESKTLSDYRVPVETREDEVEALAAARFLITPHSQIADLMGDRAIKLDWQIPQMNRSQTIGDNIVFPSSTLGRKGCYEMRELAREFAFTLQVAGPILEAPDFWSNVDVASASPDWLEHAGLIILPAWVEHWPRRLLRAAAAGVPVIASTACGLRGISNVAEAPVGDFFALRTCVETQLKRLRA